MTTSKVYLDLFPLCFFSHWMFCGFQLGATNFFFGGRELNLWEACFPCYRWLDKLNQLDTAVAQDVPLLLIPSIGNLAGDRYREQSSHEAGLKEVCGSTVICSGLCEDSVLKSFQPVDEKYVYIPLHMSWRNSELTRNNY